MSNEKGTEAAWEDYRRRTKISLDPLTEEGWKELETKLSSLALIVVDLPIESALRELSESKSAAVAVAKIARVPPQYLNHALYSDNAKRFEEMLRMLLGVKRVALRQMREELEAKEKQA